MSGLRSMLARSVESSPTLVRRSVYAARSRWRAVRVDRRLTRWLGPHYRRSRDAIELDITWACNLKCLNCNRSVRQAPTGEGMTAAQVVAFLRESEAQGHTWRQIRLLGGEPALHPELDAIVEALEAYRTRHPGVDIALVTNGHGPKVERVLARLEGRLRVENSAKTGDVQPHFGAFNDAPREDPRFTDADFGNACWVARDCGMGLTPYGYYPCAVAGGIDRVLGLGLGRAELPGPDDDMRQELEALCAWCGHFREGNRIPADLVPPITDERMSPGWERAYASWRSRRPALPRYGE